MTRMRSWTLGSAFGALVVALAGCVDPTPITRTPDAVQLTSTVGLMPIPVDCPSAGRKLTRGVIGPEGGSIAVGNTVFTLPAGAVDRPQQFVLFLPPSKYLEIEVEASGHRTFQFAKPATVTVDYSRCTAPDPSQMDVAMWHVDARTGAFLERMGGVVDPTAKTITFTTPHLSVYLMAE